MIDLPRDSAKTTLKGSDGNGKSFTQGLIKRVKGTNFLFLITVVLPTLLSIIYFGLIASDVYVSESRFVVRSPQNKSDSSLSISSLVPGSGFSHSSEDIYTVQDFILSRDAIKLLEDNFGIIKTYSNPKIDRFSRFAGIDWDDSFEAFLFYYRRAIVALDIGGASPDATLTVRAFSAEDAYRINEKLLEMSEDLVNQLNERGRQDMIGFAGNDVASAEKLAKGAALALSTFRNQKNVMDPESQSAIQLQLIAKLQDEMIATKSRLIQLQSFASNGPQVPYLQRQMKILQQEIDEETDRVAGGKRSLAEKASQFQRLTLERDYADKQLSSALASLEAARNEALRKQLYLERVVQPNKPAVAIEPRRIRSVFVTFVLGLIAWGILTILLASIREHRD